MAYVITIKASQSRRIISFLVIATVTVDWSRSKELATVATRISFQALNCRSLGINNQARGAVASCRFFVSLAIRPRAVRMPSQARTLTPEQIALSEERKRKKAEAALRAPSPQKPVETAKILERRWLTLPTLTEETSKNSFTVMTWNVCDYSIAILPTA